MRRLIAWFNRYFKGNEEFVVLSGEEVLKPPPRPGYFVVKEDGAWRYKPLDGSWRKKDE